MLEKKYNDKRFIKNWRPISLLNAYLKIISKVVSTRIKNVLLFLILLIKQYMIKISLSAKVEE